MANEKLLTRRKLWKRELLESGGKQDLVILNSTDMYWWVGNTPRKERKPVSIRKRIEYSVPRDSQDHRKPDRRAMQSALSHLKRMEDRVDRINQNNAKHSWKAFRLIESVTGQPRYVPFQPSVMLMQIHSVELGRAARLYTGTPLSAQCMSKAQRQELEIDNQPIVELDFSCYHLRMLYHRLKLDPAGDLYRPELVFPTFWKSCSDKMLKARCRGFLKQATNITLNTSTRRRAVLAIAKLIRECPRVVRGAVLPDIQNADGLLKRIEAAHPDLAGAGYFCRNAACDLMTKDGRIMLQILEEFADADKPALGVHDSLIVKLSDEKFARGVMEGVYRLFIGLKPEVH
jgi:hypothetical protein